MKKVEMMLMRMMLMNMQWWMKKEVLIDVKLSKLISAEDVIHKSRDDRHQETLKPSKRFVKLPATPA